MSAPKEFCGGIRELASAVRAADEQGCAWKTVGKYLERGTMQPYDLPGTHPGVYREAAAAGVFGESMAANLADLWRDHRAKTYYQGGLASAARADAMYELATELHAYVTGQSRQGHECICEEPT